MNLLIVVDTVIEISETFIYTQIKGTSANKIVLCYKRKNQSLFPIDFPVQLVNSNPHKPIDRILSKIYRTVTNTFFAYPISSILKIRKILTTHKIDCIHAHFGPNGLKILPIAKQYNIPLVVSFHGYDASKLISNKQYQKELVSLFDYAHAVITVSEYMTKKLLPFGLKLEKNHIIPYGIDLSSFAPKIRQESNSDKVTILHAGRIVPKKGVIDLIKVIYLLRNLNIHVVIIGDGKDLGKVQEYVKQYKLESIVTLLGAKPHESVKEYMQCADIFVLNSRTDEEGDEEGLPNTILEAMAIGLPIISTYHAGIPDAIADGENGILVPEKDNEALKQGMERLITDYNLRKELGIQALKRSREFSQTIMISKLNKVFKSL